MKFLLDTNVVSELRKRDRANRRVREWLAGVEGGDLAISVLVLGEIRSGILRLARRDPEVAGHLTRWLGRLERAYRGRTFAIDREVVEVWATLNVERPLSVLDSLQGATAIVHGLTFVTRNVSDLEGTAVRVLNPFSDG